MAPGCAQGADPVEEARVVTLCDTAASTSRAFIPPCIRARDEERSASLGPAASRTKPEP